jgi:hypothetical protein
MSNTLELRILPGPVLSWNSFVVCERVRREGIMSTGGFVPRDHVAVVGENETQR